MRKLILLTGWLAILSVGSSQAETVVALTSGNRLLFFNNATPGNVTKSLSITNLGSDTLIAIDFRPATGDLYALAASSRFYGISLANGRAEVLSNTPTALSGARFGFDFNPGDDRMRVTSDADQDIRVNPNDGTLTMADPALTYTAGDSHFGANPNVVGSAHTNNFFGAVATVLYNIDSTFDVLVIQNPANSGILKTVGGLGTNTTDNVGFDISQGTGVAWASLTVGSGVTGLFRIDLASGAATTFGPIGDATSLAGETVVDIAVPTATRLLNISSRGRVGTGDDVLIGGFINRGGGRVVLRAIGPSLSAFGVASPLPDPVLTLVDTFGRVLMTNDDWRSTQEADITATGLAPSNNLESTILITLPPGSYTGIVSGKGPATGLALVEIYQLP